MGNTFTAQGFKDALSWQNVVEGIKHPDTTPRTGSMPTFDAHEGFDYQRKPRGNIAFFTSPILQTRIQLGQSILLLPNPSSSRLTMIHGGLSIETPLAPC